MEEATFTYSPLGKALEKQTKKKVDALKSLNLYNKVDEKKLKIYFQKACWMIWLPIKYKKPFIYKIVLN